MGSFEFNFPIQSWEIFHLFKFPDCFSEKGPEELALALYPCHVSDSKSFTMGRRKILVTESNRPGCNADYYAWIYTALATDIPSL